MSSRGDISGAVVVVSPDGALAGDLSAQLGQAVRVVALSSPYEGAAEILAGGVAVLVADLRLMRGPHGKLLEIARIRKVTMLGVGALPVGFCADDLAGLMLARRADLAPTVREALARMSEATPASQPAGQAQTVVPQPQASPSPEPTGEQANLDTASGQVRAPQPPKETQRPKEPRQNELKDEALLSLLEGRQGAPFERGLEQEMRFELELTESPAEPAAPRPGKKPVPVPIASPAPAPATPAAPTGQPLEQGLLSPEELNALLRGD